MKTIKKGNSGLEVKVAQALLGLEVTGAFDKSMYDAVCALQQKHGLKVDGIIGPNTLAKLAANAPTVRNKKSDPFATLAVQLLLGFTGEDLDGICGSKTRAKIKSYQASCGLDADCVVGQQTWNSLLGLSENVVSSKINACVHYLQWDSRWKNKKYSTHTSSQTIGNSGCGPTAMAMIMAQFLDSKYTPVEMCEYALKSGYRTKNNGTAWGFYEWCFDHFDKFSKFIQTNSLTVLKAALAEGALAVCSMNSNDNCFWTKSGHFITAIGFDSKYMYANDPNKSTHPRKQAHAKFKSCMKQAFIFWP